MRRACACCGFRFYPWRDTQQLCGWCADLRCTPGSPRCKSWDVEPAAPVYEPDDTPEPRSYEEHHFANVEDVGVAFNHDRVWVCLNGQATLRAKVMPSGQLLVEYFKPEGLHERTAEDDTPELDTYPGRAALTDQESWKLERWEDAHRNWLEENS